MNKEQKKLFKRMNVEKAKPVRDAKKIRALAKAIVKAEDSDMEYLDGKDSRPVKGQRCGARSYRYASWGSDDE